MPGVNLIGPLFCYAYGHFADLLTVFSQIGVAQIGLRCYSQEVASDDGTKRTALSRESSGLQAAERCGTVKKLQMSFAPGGSQLAIEFGR